MDNRIVAILTGLAIILLVFNISFGIFLCPYDGMYHAVAIRQGQYSTYNDDFICPLTGEVVHLLVYDAWHVYVIECKLCGD